MYQLTRSLFASGLVLLGVGAAGSHMAPSSGGTFDTTWHTIDGGGGTSSAAEFTIHATIGQVDAGTMTGGAFELRGGFQPGAAPSAPICVGDLSGDAQIGFDDLLVVLSAWGDCAACAADLDGDGLVGFSDLLIVLSGWGACP